MASSSGTGHDAPQDGDFVIDRARTQLYGETLGHVLRPMGPYRCVVEWADSRGEQLEKNDDLEVVRDG